MLQVIAFRHWSACAYCWNSSKLRACTLFAGAWLTEYYASEQGCIESIVMVLQNSEQFLEKWTF